MDYRLNPELEKYIDEQVKAGRFSSATEALEAGIARLMLDPEPDVLDEDDVAAIEESEHQIARGEDLDWREARVELCKKYLGR